MPTAVGDLGAIIRIPAATIPLPGVVLVDGSGDGDRFDWGGWPEWLADAGSIVLRHDKPGCGGCPGHWTEQTLEDRARETLAAVRVLRAHPATAGQPVGLYGISQGGWVALLAAALEPESVDFVVCHSGPGTTPAQQERERLETWVRAEGHDEATVTEAMAWVDARADLIRRGTSAEAVLAEQSRYAGRPWYATVLFPYDTPANLRFLRGMLDFDPTTVMPQVRCPVLTLFGAADTVIPVQASVAAFAEYLPPHPEHGFAVFPGADHGLYIAEPDPAVSRRDQLAPAYLATVGAFLTGRQVVS
ncbi:alpha/beta hydrolase family protein [Jiangella alba]|uniref:alpha/beta hydrolase family protein n=1 Tax=Jiangella alba TaxID=561176 RepID=UPI001495FE44|nr:alpha/beta hydrolase [Jiangella alba]